jgi:DNA-binding IscR family transcriptional regulator
MAGIYFSWLVLLFGAQVSYAYQNRALYLQERLAENVNQRGREFVAMRLMTCIGQQFQRGLRPPTVEQMSEELAIPSRLVHQVLQTLVAAHLVIEIAGAEPAFTPGRPLEQINAHHILQAMRARGQELLTRDEPVRQEVYGEFARIEQAEKLAASSVSMLALVNRADARLELVPPSEPVKEIQISPALVPTQAETIVQEPMAEPPIKIPKPEEPAPISASKSPKPDEKKWEPDLQHEPEVPPVVARSAEAKPSPSVPVPKPPIAEPIPDDEREFPL